MGDCVAYRKSSISHGLAKLDYMQQSCICWSSTNMSTEGWLIKPMVWYLATKLGEHLQSKVADAASQDWSTICNEVAWLMYAVGFDQHFATKRCTKNSIWNWNETQTILQQSCASMFSKAEQVDRRLQNDAQMKSKMKPKCRIKIYFTNGI